MLRVEPLAQISYSDGENLLVAARANDITSPVYSSIVPLSYLRDENNFFGLETPKPSVAIGFQHSIYLSSATHSAAREEKRNERQHDQGCTKSFSVHSCLLIKLRFRTGPRQLLLIRLINVQVKSITQ